MKKSDTKNITDPTLGRPTSSKGRAISIQRKIMVGFIGLIVLLTISMTVVMNEMGAIEKSASSVITTRQPIAVRFLRFSDNINLSTTFLNGYLLTGHDDYKQRFLKLSSVLKEEIRYFNTIAYAENSIIDKVKIKEFGDVMGQFFKYADNLFLLSGSLLENYPGLKLANEKLMPSANNYLSTADSLMDFIRDERVTEKNYEILGLLSETRYSWQQIMNTLRLFLNSRVTESVSNIELYIELNAQQFEELKGLAVNIGFGEIEDMERYANEWRLHWREVTDIYLSDAYRKDAYMMKTEVEPIVEKLRVLLLDLSNAQVLASKQDGADLTDSIGNIRMYSSILMFISLVLCIVIAITISRAVIPPIKCLVKASQRVADGHLDTSIPIVRHDEMGELSESFNRMVNDLDVAEKDRQQHMNEVNRWNQDLEQRVEEKVTELKSAQGQLLQSEKLASIGQLAAGVAHEINNPVGYINSNVGTLEKYIAELFKVLDAYQQLEDTLSDKAVLENVLTVKKEVELDYLKQDISELISESQEGVTRVKQIVQDLKDFSHVDEAEWQWVDIHKGINSTLNVAHNEIKYKAEVVKEYGSLPKIECIPSQLNQVFMNLVVNAAHAIEERGVITIKSGFTDESIWVSVTDTGVGIPTEVQKRIFEPFYTTKAVGKGTGLGLSLSYGIIEKHHGEIIVDSTPGKGTTFKVVLPIQHQDEDNNDVTSSAA